ncbi:MAG: signal peptidase I [Gammaproteobacteria bacterium]|nr:signal peptidase I [Gammaproteobacteria bacterium]
MKLAVAVAEPDLSSNPVDDHNNPRKPWLAALMSLMLPGYGQLYNGQFNRGTWFFLIFVAFALPIVTLAALYVPAGWMMATLLLGCVGGIGVWLLSVVDAYRCAKARQSYQCKPWQRGGMYVSVYVLCSLIGLPAAVEYVRSKQVQSFRTASNSMRPSLLEGDLFFADMRYNCANCAQEVQRGDVAVFIYPNNRNKVFVKRIVALPGDEVIYQGLDAVAVNGQPLIDPLQSENLENKADDGLVFEESQDLAERSIEASSLAPNTVIVVPPREVFVMGDNWRASADSRTVGTVPLSDIRGLVRQIWFSKDDTGIRWDRIGRDLRNM